MQLTYRGQAYTSSDTPAVKRQSFTYRSQSYQSSASAAVPPKTNLVYRGVSYRKGEVSKLATIMGFEHHQVALSCPLPV